MRVELVSLAVALTLGLSPRVAAALGPASEASVAGSSEAEGEAREKDQGPAKISERLQDPQARRYYEAANRYFVDGRYGLAAQQLGFAYSVEPLPELLVQRALVLDAAGRCTEGIPLLEDFLRSGPRPQRARRAQLLIDDCRKRSGLAATPASPSGGPSGGPPPGAGGASAGRPVPSEQPDATPDPKVGAELARAEAPWYRDAAGGVLLGLGVAGLATGAGLMIASAPASKRAATSVLHSDYAENDRQARVLQSFGSGALVAGAALTIGAIIRYRGRRAGAEGRPQASGWIDRRGAGVALGGRF